MSDLDNGICYLCGEEGADSRDHVPPKAVLPKDYRSVGEDLITVPAHQECNRDWKDDDEYFQTQIALAAFTAGDAGEALHSKVMRGLDREEATGLREHIDSGITGTTVLLSDGTVDRDYIQVKPDWERLLGVIARTGRGIYYHEMKDIIPLNVSEKPVVAEPEKVIPIFESNTDHVRSFAGSSFKYISVMGEEEPHRCGYLFNFFDRLFFSVVFHDEEGSWCAV